MTDQEFIERLTRIEEHVRSIDVRLAEKIVCCRHVTEDGKCDFLPTVIDHDRKINQWAPDIKKIDEHDMKINQWTGALAAVAMLCSIIGGLIAVIIGKVWK